MLSDLVGSTAFIACPPLELLAFADRILQPRRHTDEDLVASLAARNAAPNLGVALGTEARGLRALAGGPATAFSALLGA